MDKTNAHRNFEAENKIKEDYIFEIKNLKNEEEIMVRIIDVQIYIYIYIFIFM
jgi:hypothetical protein